MTIQFDPAMVSAPPLYSLNLSAAERSLLDWMERNGFLLDVKHLDAKVAAEAIGVVPNTVYVAARRLAGLKLLLGGGGAYQINARYFFATNPLVRDLLAKAIEAPEIQPDARAAGPRKMGNIAARRRRLIRPVKDTA
ncbi:MarR family transcriptional regulator [Kitasatospora sp. NPDC056076]|uniref:MarR family transcriptional regulator n=1 Tax=Kitasatospora sp. NPDC056076 TaxID=3345703 RepID=UPI0035D7BB64